MSFIIAQFSLFGYLFLCGVSLKDKTILVRFNTWRYSQFSMDNALALSLLGTLVKECAETDETKAKKKKKIERLKESLNALLSIALSVKFSLGNAEMGMSNPIANFLNDEDGAKDLDSLRKDFEALISDTLIDKGKDRFVIFIDDLDRLEPKKALELLEVLHSFMRCKGCVFVLAVDTDVVKRGVIEKYGTKDADENSNFFDKIIQFQFKMPIQDYCIDSFVDTALGLMNLSDGFDDTDKENLTSLLECATGKNPRTIKQLLNEFQFQMLYDEEKSDKSERMLAFALLCLRKANPGVYARTMEAIDNKRSLPQADDFDENVSGIMEIAQNFYECGQSVSLLNAIPPTAKEYWDFNIPAHTLTVTEAKYNILTLGKHYDIGLNQPIDVLYTDAQDDMQTKRAHMHKSTAGRLDGLTQVFRALGVKAGDTLQIEYEYSRDASQPIAGTLKLTKAAS